CRFSLDELQYEYPEEPIPEGMTPQQRLGQLTWEGAADRFTPIGDIAGGASFAARTAPAPQDEGSFLNGIKEVPHPEEAAEQPSRRTHRSIPKSPTVGLDASAIPDHIRDRI